MLPIQKGFVALAGALLWLCWMSMRSRSHSELRAKVLEVVAAAARRDLPLAPALERMAKGARGKARHTLEQLSSRLRDGVPVWQALDESLPHRSLPVYLIDTLRSVEGTAGLRPALASLAIAKERALRVRDRLSMALAYPSLLAVMLVGLFVTTETLLDQDALAAEATGVAGDGGTALSESAAEGSALLLCGALAVALLSYVAGSRSQLRSLLDHFANWLPWTRRLGREAATGRMLRIAAHLTRAEVPLGAMLRRVAPATGKAELEISARAAADAADAGAPVEEVWRTCGLPNHAAVRLSVCPHGHPGQLADRMLAAADACDRRVERSVERAIGIVQPAALLFFGALIAMHFASVISVVDSQRYAQGGLPW